MRSNLVWSATRMTWRALSMIACATLHLAIVEVEQRAVLVDGRGADHRVVDLELPDEIDRRLADDAAVASRAPTPPAMITSMRGMIAHALATLMLLVITISPSWSSSARADLLGRGADVDEQRGSCWGSARPPRGRSPPSRRPRSCGAPHIPCSRRPTGRSRRHGCGRAARWSQRSLRSLRMVCGVTSKWPARSSTSTRPWSFAIWMISAWRGGRYMASSRFRFCA